MRKFLSIKFVRNLLRVFFSLFYSKRYLRGLYFDKKCMGWLWAFRSLKNKLFGANKKVPWPVNPLTVVNGSNNIIFDVNDLHIFQVPGCYWQAHSAKITIGSNCHIAPNVGIITTNHDIYDVAKHSEGKSVCIGKNCWIGMNSVILPGVNLGDHTIVGAGSIVTKSFTDGYCVIGGNPAKIIKYLDKEKCEVN